MLDPTLAQYSANGLVVAIVTAKGVIDYYRGHKRDRQKTSIDTQLGSRLLSIERALDRLEAWVVGPDGENGIRGDVREINDRVKGLEERERTRLERLGTYDRRGA